MDHIPFFAAVVPREHGSINLGRHVLWICGCESECVSDIANDRGNYEECVVRRFGASESIRLDREPGSMSDFFRAFNRIVGQIKTIYYG